MDRITEKEFDEYMSGFKPGTPSNIIEWCQMRKSEPLKFGKIDYVFKPRSKYPARIYLFFHAGEFMQRNRRPMGCMDKPSFESRFMTRQEVIETHFDMRMRYYQYENWQEMIDAEKNELGHDHDFIIKLENHRLIFEPQLLKEMYKK